MMNERIGELAEQALDIVSNKRMLRDGQLERTWDPYEYDCVFAELIVRECASVCDAYAMTDGTSQVAMILSSAIKARFGIENTTGETNA